MTTWVDAGWYGRLCREIVNETGSRAICRVHTRQNSKHKTRDGTEPWLEGEANFRLILQAPQMLEALCSIRDKARLVLLSTYAPGGTHQPHKDAADWETVMERAVTAIAAVKGENGDEDELV